MTRVTYEGGAGSTQVAAFEYDALGRMISSQLRFDADSSAMNETLKYYYDGSNVLAVYDESDNLVRKFIHGTHGLDERAVLLEGDGEVIDEILNYWAVDVFYYMLEELDTVTGLITRNGTLAEAYTYDAYGNVKPWGYRLLDVNRDGDVDDDDEDVWWLTYMTSPPTVPMVDANVDGIIDEVDWSWWYFNWTGEDEPPITLGTSAIGNPYFFTGRRLHFFETLHDGSPEGTDVNERVQYNRARHYASKHGRWLQRDPLEYVDGMNLYEYVRSSPTTGVDPSGLSSLGVSIVKDNKYLAVGTRINVKTPKCRCRSLKWMQYVVYEKRVYMHPVTTLLTTRLCRKTH